VDTSSDSDDTQTYPDEMADPNDTEGASEEPGKEYASPEEREPDEEKPQKQRTKRRRMDPADD